MARVTRLGWERELAVETRPNSKPRKTLENAARTYRQLHAVLGAVWMKEKQFRLHWIVSC
jgi:hypothetical protein